MDAFRPNSVALDVLGVFAPVGFPLTGAGACAILRLGNSQGGML